VREKSAILRFKNVNMCIGHRPLSEWMLFLNESFGVINDNVKKKKRALVWGEMVDCPYGILVALSVVISTMLSIKGDLETRGLHICQHNRFYAALRIISTRGEPSLSFFSMLSFFSSTATLLPLKLMCQP
jgi:hypothetical protein